MYVPQTQVDKTSSTFKKNLQAMTCQVADLRKTLQTIYQGGDERARARHQAKGKLFVRERIARLLDSGQSFSAQPFVELSPLAGYQLYDEALPAAGLITGIGFIHGKACMIIANDATVKGGSYFPMTIKKHLRAQAIAKDNHLPCIYLVDSAGAYLPKQAQLFADQDHFGRIFFNQAQLSAQGIPQIAVVMGHCIAGGAYLPAMSDECIIVKQQGTIFLAGPPLVKAATGETVDAQTLGGAETHCKKSGVTDYYAHNETEALEKLRHIIEYLVHLPNQQAQKPPRIPEPPALDQKEIYGIIQSEQGQGCSYDVREIIWRLVDASRFEEFKPLYGSTLICGFAYINGYPIAIIANNGILLSESALKACHFIQLCCQRHIPLLFLQNVTGFMVGKHYEQQGITKHGAKMVQAVSCANIPKFTILIGGSFGAANYAMCGRAYQPRFLWSWPNARIGIMGGIQAKQVLDEIYRKKASSTAKKKKNQQTVDQIVENYQKESEAYYASQHLWDDGMIDPLDTRRLLTTALHLAYSGRPNPPNTIWPTWRM